MSPIKGLGFLALLCLMGLKANGQQLLEQLITQVSNSEPSANFPYYLQSPLVSNLAPNTESNVDQRSVKLNRPPKIYSNARKINANPSMVNPGPLIEPPVTNDPPQRLNQEGCLYDKRYFAKLDECLARKPYPTVGLVAFKNEDLLIKRGFTEKYGCSFILNNGLFKNHQINRYFMDTDSQCLDGNKVSLSFGFSNVTLTYLWTLRCLNRADQLLEDSTLESELSKQNDVSSTGSANRIKSHESEVCIGSSQNFGFSSLQLNGVEAQVELYTDLYKNWRVTNVTVAMMNPNLLQSTSRSSSLNTGSHDNHNEEILGTNIKDYVFDSLDGDELNWRYLHLFKNWSRNRMHSNFLDQYRRFLWISLQRCLSEATEKLPTKVMDVFANQRYM